MQVVCMAMQWVWKQWTLHTLMLTQVGKCTGGRYGAHMEAEKTSHGSVSQGPQ